LRIGVLRLQCAGVNSKVKALAQVMSILRANQGSGTAVLLIIKIGDYIFGGCVQAELTIIPVIKIEVVVGNNFSSLREPAAELS